MDELHQTIAYKVVKDTNDITSYLLLLACILILRSFFAVYKPTMDLFKLPADLVSLLPISVLQVCLALASLLGQLLGLAKC